MGRQAGGGDDGIAPGQGVQGQRAEGGALGPAGQVRRQGADPLRHVAGPGVGRADQGRQDQGFRVAQAGRTLVEQAPGGGVDAGEFAPEGGQVEVGLQDVRFIPASFNLPGRPHLAQFFRHVPAPRLRAISAIQQGGQLHGEGGGAPGLLVQPVGQRRLAGRQPVHAGMPEKAPVLGAQHRRDQGGGDVGEGRPVGTADGRIDAHLLDQPAVPIQNARLGRSPVGLDLDVAWKIGGRGGGRRGEGQAEQQKACSDGGFERAHDRDSDHRDHETIIRIAPVRRTACHNSSVSIR
jgi:hypothetical protein